MEDDFDHDHVPGLHHIANEVEKAVLLDNIYKAEVYERLLELEAAIDNMRSQTGQAIQDVLNNAGIRQPIDVLNSAIRYWDGKLKPEQLGSEEDLIRLLEEDFKIKVKRTKTVGIPADELQDKIERTKEDQEGRNKVDFNRVALALRTVLHMKVEGEPILLDDIDEPTISDVSLDSHRKRPYWSINVKKYRIAVFVNNEYANRTFIAGYKTEKDYEKLFRSTKSQLKQKPQVRHFEFENAEQFTSEFTAAFEAIYQGQQIKPMDVVYFSSSENVKADLENYALKIGKTVEDINVENISSADITCVNGENVRGQTYLKRAALNLGLADNLAKAASFQGPALKLLKEKVGLKVIFAPMDEAYFTNPEKVLEDLEMMAKANKLTVAELPTSTKIVRKKYTFSTGEKLHGNVYLTRAAIALGFAKESIKAGHIHGPTLVRLKEIAGYKIETFPQMDLAYFGDREKVYQDLQAYAEKLGKTIEDLNTENISAKEIVCSNGEKLKGQTYLKRATLALGLTDDPDKAGSFQKKALNKLKKVIGIEVPAEMDAEYFSGNEKLAADMEAISKILQRPVDDLSVDSLSKQKILCANGETIGAKTYLDRFAVASGMANNSREALKMRIKVLEIIKKRLKESLS